MLTDPDDAARFVEQSGCDSLAVASGTSHGAYKFKGKQGLHFHRLAEIQQRLSYGTAGAHQPNGGTCRETDRSMA